MGFMREHAITQVITSIEPRRYVWLNPTNQWSSKSKHPVISIQLATLGWAVFKDPDGCILRGGPVFKASVIGVSYKGIMKFSTLKGHHHMQLEDSLPLSCADCVKCFSVRNTTTFRA